MFRDYSWFEPVPGNFPVDKRRLLVWRRWAEYYRTSPEFKLLTQIEAKREKIASQPGESANVLWLLPFRGPIRRVLSRFHCTGQQGEIEAIRYYMAYCPRDMIPICIWLIGKCGERFHAYEISEFCRNQPSHVRKHVVKALRRLEAWWLLEEMAGLYHYDTRLQRIIKSPVTRRPFGERLSAYVKSVDDSHAGEVSTPSRMPFWAMEQSWDYTPPKSVQLIRRMLRRIRHWVRWGVN